MAKQAANRIDVETANRGTSIARLLEDARRRLVETGTRNRLIHVNRKASRGNFLNIVNEKSDEIFEILYRKSRRMKFLALRKDIEEQDASDTPLLGDFEGTETVDESRYTDNNLETFLTKDGLQKRLLRLAKEAEAAEQEQGINILFFAMGFLNWFEDKSSAVQRSAPLILLPVILTRNVKTATYDISIRDDEIVANLPLQERLQEDFGIALPEIEVEEEWKPDRYFDVIDQQIKQRENWSIDRDDMQLGFFSFAKLLMLRDLDPNNWTGDALTRNALITGLLKEGFESKSPLFPPEDKLDEKLSPAEIIQVVDADASQTKVIEEVRSGRNLVVQGPPGTGKSQTITNIIASAVHDGKSVLFMAEKMAALSVVRDKLKKNGLDHVALELHSRQANKKAVLSSIKQTLVASRKVLSVPDNTDSLKKTRDTLNAFSSILHQEIPETDETPFSLMGVQARLVGADTPPPTTQAPSLAKMSRAVMQRLSERLIQYGELKKKVGGLADTPLSVVSNLDMQPTDLDRSVRQIPEILSKMSKLQQCTHSALRAIGSDLPVSLETAKYLQSTFSELPAPPTALGEHKDWLLKTETSVLLKEALSIAIDYINKLRAAEERFIENCWAASLSRHRAALVQGTRSFWSRLGPRYRSGSNELASVLTAPLPKKAQDRLELLDSFLAVQSAKKKFDEDTAYLQGQLGDSWRGERTDFSVFWDLASWWESIRIKLDTCQKAILVNNFVDGFSPNHLSERIQVAQKGFVQSYKVLDTLAVISKTEPESKGHQAIDLNFDPFAEVAQKLEALKISLVANYEDWRQMQRVLQEFEELELSSLLVSVDKGDDPERVVRELHFARAEHIWKSVLSNDVQDLVVQDRHQLVELYQKLEKERVEDTKKQILSIFYNKVPQGAAGGMGVIQSEIGKKTRHKPIRKLISEAGETVQRIKPVFLMSPISIAQFLPPEKLVFDLLVIDEASQVRPEDALGAVARAKQIVVVGDQKQMPPSSFFDRLTSNEGDDNDEDLGLGGSAKATELESILTLCQARGLGGMPRMLEWHYRSKDPSLIAVSNKNFYDNNLILPPTPLQSDERFGLSFTYVKGVYARGKSSKNINTIEAEAVVGRVKKHAREYPTLSLGIATFSKVQQNHLNELLEHARRTDQILDLFLREGKQEDVFVKNLENVQGDERDVILVSVCYGPAEPGGRLPSMNFGPVNGEGGERRLNVLFTRARYRTEVFCSFDPRDIDIRKTSNIGPKILREYLLYAKDGVLPDAVETGLEADSDFEIDVANEIRQLGYEVDHQVGSQGFKIDLGVRDKDQSSQFILAVECDGATYHSSLWARERDRLRQGILEQHGWTFHRIWSTDWFYRRHNEVERLKKALESVSSVFKTKELTTGANFQTNFNIQEHDFETDDMPDIDISKVFERPIAEAYVSYKHTTNITSAEPHLYPFNGVKSLIEKIIETEGPIHQSEIARRYASCFGKTKAGKRIVELTDRALEVLERDSENDIVADENFYLTRARAENMWVRNRSELSGPILKADMHSRLEVAAAAEKIEEHSGVVGDDELCREIATYMGYKRTGPDLKKVLILTIEYYRDKCSRNVEEAI